MRFLVGGLGTESPAPLSSEPRSDRAGFSIHQAPTDAPSGATPPAPSPRTRPRRWPRPRPGYPGATSSRSPHSADRTPRLSHARLQRQAVVDQHRQLLGGQRLGDSARVRPPLQTPLGEALLAQPEPLAFEDQELERRSRSVAERALSVSLRASRTSNGNGGDRVQLRTPRCQHRGLRLYSPERHADRGQPEPLESGAGLEAVAEDEVCPVLECAVVGPVSGELERDALATRPRERLIEQ